MREICIFSEKLLQCSDIERLKSLGFEISKPEMDYKMLLPEGWQFESKGVNEQILIDSNGNHRGSYIYDANPCGCKSSFSLLPRYTIEEDRERFIIFVKDNKNDNIIFEMKRQPRGNSMNRQVLLSVCEFFLNMNYSKWRDPLAYWDEE